MSDSKFNVGDIVKLKSGGPEMTVEDVGEDAISCVWFADTEVGRSKFLEATLKKEVTSIEQVDQLSGDPSAGNGFVTGVQVDNLSGDPGAGNGFVTSG